MLGKSCGGYVTCGLRLAPSSSGSGRGSVVNWRRGSPSLPLALSPSVPSSSCGARNWSGEQAMPASGRGEWMRPAPLLPPHRLLRRLLLAGLALRTAHHRFTPMTTAMLRSPCPSPSPCRAGLGLRAVCAGAVPCSPQRLRLVVTSPVARGQAGGALGAAALQLRMHTYSI